MAKYRKKPVVVEAWLLTSGVNDKFAQRFSLDINDSRVEIKSTYGGMILCVHIKTLEGIMTAYPGDYIIQGIQGELYPCKADIFEQTYEPVEEK
jgi:hypothetical protein